jgi:2-oxoglutarate dehydrogenase E2 component (dihydrolipoamide succinyltransferase)
MLSRSILLRKATALASPHFRHSIIRAPWQQSLWNIRFATTVVQVPQMAESISEGTLKQFSKQVGDYVEVDEEIATIETDKVRGLDTVSGNITELLPIDRCIRQRNRVRHHYQASR